MSISTASTAAYGSAVSTLRARLPRITFTTPSPRRIGWALVISVATVWLLVTIGLFHATVSDPHHSFFNGTWRDYPSQFVGILVLWTPIILLMAWPLTVPVMIAGYLLLAYTRISRAPRR